MEDLLNDVYYNLNSPACYAGVYAIYKEAKKRSKKVTYKDVREFLCRQNTYTMHKPVSRKYKTNKTISAGLDVDWQADLADMRMLKKKNSGYAYILVVIDVLSRFVWTRPIKQKTPEQVAQAMNSIINESKRKPWRLCTDRGKEFTGKTFQEFLEAQDIQYFNPDNPDFKASMAERMMSTIKKRLWRHFYRLKTSRYIEVLPKIINSINNSVNRVTGMKPSEVNKQNQHELWNKLYKKPIVQKKTPKFAIGDMVRITTERKKLEKGYIPKFTAERFRVHKILKHRNPIVYRLIDLEGEDVYGIFYEPELVKSVPKIGPYREIDHIKKSEVRDDGQIYHYVKWKDYKVPKWVTNHDLVTL